VAVVENDTVTSSKEYGIGTVQLRKVGSVVGYCRYKARVMELVNSSDNAARNDILLCARHIDRHTSVIMKHVLNPHCN
jgi:hypothetical protein